MAALVCDLCGGKLVMGAGGVATCDSCGMEHSADRMKEKVQEIKGTVRVDNSHMIENYLQMAMNAYEANNNTETESYANKIIEIEPTNYQAWLLKGKAAGWQSTIQNSRFSESVSAFSKAIANAPLDKKEAVVDDTKGEIKNLAKALISLRTSRFTKWPDGDETAGFLSDIVAILSAVVQFCKTAGVVIQADEIMAPIAVQINQAVVEAYQNKILPDYRTEKFPNKYTWETFIERIGYCTTLVEKAITLTDSDDQEDIQRYENLIFLHEQAIDSCSWTSEYLDYDPYNNGAWAVSRMEEAVKRDGNIPDAKNSRYWMRDYSLTDEAKNARKQLIQQYKAEIKNIKSRLADRKEKELQQKSDEYWAEHSDERAVLEAEKKSLNTQIKALKKEMKSVSADAELNAIKERIDKLTADKDALGFFKGKEKKAIQKEIDTANDELKEISNKIEAAKTALQRKIDPLQNRITLIDYKLMPPQKKLGTIKFGAYFQGSNTVDGKDEIEWLVLKREVDKILVISKFCLDCRAYNTKQDENITWEKCTLRAWLNKTFLNTAFSAEEQKMILPTKLFNENNQYGTLGGNDTIDKVFLLSVSEAEQYFSSDNDRKAMATSYVKAKGGFAAQNNGTWWWLRTPADYGGMVSGVNLHGEINDENGDAASADYCHIRPAMWISLELI